MLAVDHNLWEAVDDGETGRDECTVVVSPKMLWSLLVEVSNILVADIRPTTHPPKCHDVQIISAVLRQ